MWHVEPCRMTDLLLVLGWLVGVRAWVFWIS